jgi:hypothetical protein
VRPSSHARIYLSLALTLAACGKDRVCLSDETKVGDACYALQSDPRNCGSPGRTCAAGQGCQAGACVDCATTNGACGAAVVAACYNLNQVRPLTADLQPANVPLATDAGPIAFARLGDTLFTANSLSSSISAVKLAPPSSTSGDASLKVPSTGAAFVDLEKVTARGALLWVSNAGTGTLVAVDPARGVVDEVALGAAGEFVNPQGVAFAGNKAYVALAGADALAVVDVSTVPGARVLSRIDLRPLATTGASAGPSRAVAVGDRVYVTLNNVFDASFAPVPGARGRLAVVDTRTDRVAGDAIPLGDACWNASGLAQTGTKLWVACGFFDQFGSGAISGGALVPVELAGAGPVVEAAVALEHAATSVVACDGRVYAGASSSGTVLAVDPATRAVTSQLACPPATGRGSFVSDLACAF